jgi:hypothetical protein
MRPKQRTTFCDLFNLCFCVCVCVCVHACMFVYFLWESKQPKLASLLSRLLSFLIICSLACAHARVSVLFVNKIVRKVKKETVRPASREQCFRGSFIVPLLYVIPQESWKFGDYCGKVFFKSLWQSLHLFWRTNVLTIGYWNQMFFFSSQHVISRLASFVMIMRSILQ